MATFGECVRDAETRLRAASETPRLDAELLFAHALGISRAQLLARLRETEAVPARFLDLLRRRMAGEPVAYITGQCEFFSMGFHVRPPVLIPRPETEHLVETALAFLGDAPGRLLDLCTGSGCVAVAIAKHAPRVEVVAADIASHALALARENIASHTVRVQLFHGDLFDALPESVGQFDCIVANPPYVEESAWEGLARDIREYEDRNALVAGADGLSLIRRIVFEASARLRVGGLLAVEMDGSQRDAVMALLDEAGFTNIDCVHDLAGIPRIAHARRAE